MLPQTIDLLITPADFSALPGRDLSQTVCVVFDILRATSTMVTALANGAAAVIPVAEIPEALAIRRRQPDVLLAGERDGVRISAHLTGSIPFDLGNSPREFTKEVVAGKTVVTSTTNGTRALRACAHARRVLLGTFLNLRAAADFIIEEPAPQILLVCGGTYEEAAYEDVLGAGALCELIAPGSGAAAMTDSVLMARKLYDLEKHDLVAGLSQSRNGSRLLSRPELHADVAFCAQRDIYSLVAGLNKDGQVQQLPGVN